MIGDGAVQRMFLQRCSLALSRRAAIRPAPNQRGDVPDVSKPLERAAMHPRSAAMVGTKFNNGNQYRPTK